MLAPARLAIFSDAAKQSTPAGILKGMLRAPRAVIRRKVDRLKPSPEYSISAAKINRLLSELVDSSMSVV
jgi:hypothetical protein